MQGRAQNRTMPRSRTPKGRQQAESRHSCKAWFLNASYSPIGCEAALCKAFAPPNLPKTSLHGNRRFQNREKFADRNGGCRAGKFGEMREVWRGKRPLRKGSLPPPRSSSPLHEPLRRDEGVAEKHRDGHRTDAARDGRDEGAERGNRGEVHVTH